MPCMTTAFLHISRMIAMTIRSCVPALTTIAVLAGCSSDNTAPATTSIETPAAYIVNGASNNVQVIDLRTMKTDETIQLNGATFPHHVYLSPDGTRLAVAITNTDLTGGHGGHAGHGGGNYRIQIIDSGTGVIEREIAVDGMPHNAAFSKSGTQLWFGESGDPVSKVHVYGTADWTKLGTIAVGKGLSEVTFSHDGSRVFATNTGDASVTVIDPATLRAIDTVEVGMNPVGAWPAANGSMYVDNEMSQTVMEIDVASLAITSQIDLGYKPGYVAWNAHHGELWVSDATAGRVVIYGKEGSGWVQVAAIATGADAHAIGFTAGGGKALVTNQGANTVSVVDVTSRMVISTIDVGMKPNGIAIRE